MERKLGVCSYRQNCCVDAVADDGNNISSILSYSYLLGLLIGLDGGTDGIGIVCCGGGGGDELK